MRVFRSELSKLLTLPFTWIAVAAGLALPTGIAVITSLTTSPDENTGFSEIAIGVAGAIVLGAVAIGSEYTTEGEESAAGRQITTTLTATAARTRLLLAKAAAVALLAAGTAAAAVVAVFATVGLLTDAGPALDPGTAARAGGAVVFWVLMALLAFALTALTRSGVIPMAVLVANSSAVSVTYLLAQRFPAADYLPDLAGMRMFTALETSTAMTPVMGGLVMTAWAAALLVAATVVFARRDA